MFIDDKMYVYISHIIPYYSIPYSFRIHLLLKMIFKGHAPGALKSRMPSVGGPLKYFQYKEKNMAIFI